MERHILNELRWITFRCSELGDCCSLGARSLLLRLQHTHAYFMRCLFALSSESSLLLILENYIRPICVVHDRFLLDPINIKIHGYDGLATVSRLTPPPFTSLTLIRRYFFLSITNV